MFNKVVNRLAFGDLQGPAVIVYVEEQNFYS